MRDLWRWRCSRAGTISIVVLMALALGLFYRPQPLGAIFGLPAEAAFNVPLAVLTLGTFGLLALLRPDLALLFVILSAPLTYRSRGVFDARFSVEGKFFPLHELIVLIVLAATLVERGSGIGHRASGIGHRASGIGHRGSGVGGRGSGVGGRGSGVGGRASGVGQKFSVQHSAFLPVLWLLAGTIGVIIATPEGRAAALREWRWVIVEPLILYVLVRYWGRTARVRLWLLWALLLSGVGVALIGLLQLRGIDLTPLRGTGQCYSDFIVDSGGVQRTSSVYCHPNNLALWLDRVWPVALVLLIAVLYRHRSMVQRGAAARPQLLALFYAGCFVLTLSGMVLTYSKGARYAGAIVLVGLSLLPRRWWFAALTTLVLGAALAWSSFNGPERLAVTGDSSFARVSVWRSAAAMVRDHPLTGIGLDQFFFYYNPQFGRGYIDPAKTDEPNTSHPHNIILDLLLRVGPFGALIFALLVYRTARRGWQVWRSEHAQRWLVLAVLAAASVGFGHGLVDQGYFNPDLAIATWMFIGLIDGVSQET